MPEMALFRSAIIYASVVQWRPAGLSPYFVGQQLVYRNCKLTKAVFFLWKQESLRERRI